MGRRNIFQDPRIVKFLNNVCHRSSVQHSEFSHFVVEEHLQLVGALVVLRVGRVVDAAVRKDSRHVGDEETSGDVVPGKRKEISFRTLRGFIKVSRRKFLSKQQILLVLQSLRHRSQVHRVFDVLVVVGNLGRRHRMQERPARLMLTDGAENRAEMHRELVEVFAFVH